VLAEGGWELDVEIDRRGFDVLQLTENLQMKADRVNEPVVGH
jgi:hypothetical protein